MHPLPPAIDLASILAALGGCAHIGRQVAIRVGGRGLAERFVIGFVVATGWMTLVGYALGAAGLLASRPMWLLGIALGALVAGRPDHLSWNPIPLRRLWKLVRGRPYLALVLALVAWVAATNLILVLFAAPNNWDAMFYHLPRVGYYLQQGSLDPFGANYAWQEEYPKGSAVLLAGLLTIGGKADWVLGLPQLLSWAVTGAAVHALARSYRARVSTALLAGGAAMLLNIAWLESVTAQNDLLITAHIAAAALLLRRHARNRKLAFLALAGVAVGLAVGTKASALTVLPALVVAIGPKIWRWQVGLAVLVGVALFGLPAGYLDNLHRYGNPLGSDAFSRHVQPQLSAASRLASGARAATRYGFDLCSLDEAPPLRALSRVIGAAKRSMVNSLARIGFDLEIHDGAHMPFWAERVHRPDDNLSWFGPFGLLVLVGGLVGWRRRDLRWLAAAGLLFALTHCLAGPYDSVRGRLFLYGTPFGLVPFAVWASSWRRRGQVLVAAFIGLAAVHLVPAVLFRNNHDLLPNEGRPQAFWQKDRVTQMTGFHPTGPTYTQFEQRVPLHCRVGVAMSGYEYALFGARLSRTLVPLAMKARNGKVPVDNIDWLVFDRSIVQTEPGDIDLGSNLILRQIKPVEQP